MYFCFPKTPYMALFCLIFLPSICQKRLTLKEFVSKTKLSGNIWFSLEANIFWEWKVYIPMRLSQDQGYAQKKHIEFKTFLWYS